MCPRAGVPYPERVLCSLKNTIAMIEQKLGLKIEKVNGVGPDPQGNVTLVSGDSALTIEEDATQHQVTIGLDRTELPSAAVTSVNGETGAVSLDASEIPGKGANKTVMDNINTLENVGLQMRSDLNGEIIKRRNADSELRTNINNVTASLPGAAAAAVAADPTIASLVAADSQNVKLTGDQSISGVKTVLTEATRTYSTQIANSNKVKNELDNYASMVRTTGNQTIAGTKQYTGLIQITANTWTRMYLQNNAVNGSQPDNPDHSFDFRFNDANGNTIAVFQLVCGSTSRYFRIGITNLSGVTTWTTLASVTL